MNNIMSAASNHRCRPLAFGLLALALIFAAAPLRAEIKILSYHLRDRAIVTDSLMMRSRMIFEFKTSLPISQVKGAAVAGRITHDGAAMSCDTTWLFDQSGGNLGFGLPFGIPGGAYHLSMQIVAKSGQVLDTYEGDFQREDMKLFYNREVNYWDYTSPYAHVECGGYGFLTYEFESPRALNPESVVLTARMATDNKFDGRVRLALNGVQLGIFDLPAGDSGKTPGKISFRVDKGQVPPGAKIISGKNALTLSVEKEDNPQAMGLRIFDKRNLAETAAEPGIPVTLSVSAAGQAAHDYVIPVWGLEGEHVVSSFTRPFSMQFHRRQEIETGAPLPVGQADVARGYVLFRRHWLRYVYPWSIPADSERVVSLGLRMSRNDYEPLTLSVYPLRDLGSVRLELGDLTGPGGATLPASLARIHVARLLKIRSGGTSYQIVPRLLARENSVDIPIDRTTRFWVTLHVPEGTAPGAYKGVVRILPEREQSTELPLTVEVLPVTLEEVPGIVYTMCMSYEGFELESKDLDAAQKEKIYRDAVNVCLDYREHGLNSMMVSSPYYFQWNADGSPRLEHLKGFLRASREAGFDKMIYWYFAHYLQAAKNQHPGNIRLYDSKVHTKRAQFLVREALRLDRELGAPPLGFMPIDEPRIMLRQQIAKELFHAVKQVPGTITACTTDIGGKDLDIEIDTGEDSLLLAPGVYERHARRQVWEYHNEAVDCANPACSRFIYGLFTWRQDLDGMNSWGPSTTENSRGNPYEDLDHENPDYMLFYPHTERPWPSVNWESLREGIDDVRYIYQLDRLIKAKSAVAPQDCRAASDWLNGLRAMCDVKESTMLNDFGPWTPERYDSMRAGLIDWVLKLQGK